VHVKHVPSPVIHDCRSQVADLQLLIDNLRRDNTTLKRGHLDLRNDIQSLLAQIRNLVSDAAEHQRTVVQLQQIIARYKGTGDLRVQLDESRARIARLMTDIQARDSHIHDLEQQLAAERARVSHLTMLLHKFDGVNIDDLHKQLDEAHRVNHEYAQKIEMLIRHIKFFTSQLHKNEPELSELRAQITQLRGEMRTRIEELEKLHLENDKFRQLIHDLTQERDTLREQNGRFAGQLTDMRAHYESELDRLRRELGDLQSRVPSATDMDAMVRIKKHVGELMHEISQLKFTNKHLTENNAQLQQRITALEHQLTELNAAHRLQVEELVRKHDAAVSELEAQIAQGRSERAALEAAIARHEEAMRQLAEQDERHKQDAEHWHALFNRANHDLEEHQRQLQECRAAQNPDELARLGRENAELQRQLQECLTGRADQSENDRLGREVADLQRQLQECLTGRADQSENDRLGREVADLQRQLQECRASQNPDELARLGRENADLQRRLQECLTGRADQSEIDRLGREVTDLQRQLQECRAAQNPDEIDRLSRENTDLQRRLQECLTGRADQSENDRLGREVADLQRRLQECLTGSDQSEIDRLGREIADWKRRYDELKASCKDAAEFARLQHQLEGTVTHLTRLQHEVAGCGEKDRTIAQLRERIRSLEAELLRARPDAAEDPELDRLRALVASLEHRIQVLERELAVALERNRRAVVVNTSVVRQNSSQQEYIRELEADQDTVEIHSRESIPLKELRIKAASMIRNMPPGTKVDMTSDEAYTSENPAKLYSLIEKLWSDHPSTFRPFYDWASQPRWYREIMIGSRLKPSERSEIGKLSDAALADRWMR
jgi:chromosome segregation ATPase